MTDDEWMAFYSNTIIRFRPLYKFLKELTAITDVLANVKFGIAANDKRLLILNDDSKNFFEKNFSPREMDSLNKVIS